MDEEKSNLQKTLKDLLFKAGKKYGNRKKALAAMGIKEKTMEDYLYNTEKRSKGSLTKYIVRIEKFLEKQQPAGEPQGPVVAAIEISEAIKKFGGGTSARGVPCVITGKSFRPIKGYPGKEGIEFAAKNIQLVRSLLNVFSQQADDADREKIKKALGPEVEELFLAIKAFSQAFPNKILDLLDAQREHWEAIEKEKERGTETGKEVSR